MEKEIRKEGRAIGINESGNLIVETKEGKVILSAGEFKIYIPFKIHTHFARKDFQNLLFCFFVPLFHLCCPPLYTIYESMD